MEHLGIKKIDLLWLCCWRISFPEQGLPLRSFRSRERPEVCGTGGSRCHCLGDLDADSQRMGVHQRIRSSLGFCLSLLVNIHPLVLSKEPMKTAIYSWLFHWKWWLPKVVIAHVQFKCLPALSPAFCFFFCWLVSFGSCKSKVVVGDHRGRLFTYEGGSLADQFCLTSWGLGEES